MQPEISSVTAEDVPAAWRLSTQAGWNQTLEDWERLLAVQPDGLIAVRLDGHLRATASYVTYGGELAWIGMVLVDEAVRGYGLGNLVFRTILEQAISSGVAAVGLDATDLGRPIYRKQGFEDRCAIHRWGWSLVRFERSGAARELIAGGAEVEEVIEFDRRSAGCDRSVLLRTLIGHPGVRTWYLPERGSAGCRGYVCLRPGRLSFQLGPLVASDRAACRSLLEAAAQATAAADVIADAVESSMSAALLPSAGLGIRRTLSRMIRPADGVALAASPLRLAAGFEWG